MSLKLLHLPFSRFLEYLPLFLDDNVDEKNTKFSNSKSSASGFFLAFAYFCQFQSGLAYKSVPCKKSM